MGVTRLGPLQSHVKNEALTPLTAVGHNRLGPQNTSSSGLCTLRMCEFFSLLIKWERFCKWHLVCTKRLQSVRIPCKKKGLSFVQELISRPVGFLPQPDPSHFGPHHRGGVGVGKKSRNIGQTLATMQRTGRKAQCGEANCGPGGKRA